jgi:hypothetical protein
MNDYVTCPHCREKTHLNGLIGEHTNDCPKCGNRALNPDQQPNYSSTPGEIVDYYDSHLNLTLRELSNMTGRSIPYLKALIMHPQKVPA